MRPRGLPVLLAPLVVMTMFVEPRHVPEYARQTAPESFARVRHVAGAGDCRPADEFSPQLVSAQTTGAAARSAAAGPGGAAAPVTARTSQGDRPAGHLVARWVARARHGIGHGVGSAPGQTQALDDDLRRRLWASYGTADPRIIESRHRWVDRITVPVRFHMVTEGRLGRVPRAAVERQIAMLNAAYGGKFGGVDTGVSFRLDGIQRTDNSDWFRSPHANEEPMMRAVRRGDAKTLNLVTAAVGVDLLGFSTFPQWYADAPDRDGVVVDYRSLPGGAFRGFHRGFTAVHEIGHWLGLFHTFENGCASPGDYVADTPYQGVPTHDCPKGKDTCTQQGLDSVHNFMDYSPDSCMREFSGGQGRRIRVSWMAYRAGLR